MAEPLSDDQIDFYQFPKINPDVDYAEDAPTDTFHIPAGARNVDVLVVEARHDVARVARDIFDAYLPLVRYEAQPGLGLAIVKGLIEAHGGQISGCICIFTFTENSDDDQRPGSCHATRLSQRMHRIRRKLKLVKTGYQIKGLV